MGEVDRQLDFFPWTQSAAIVEGPKGCIRELGDIVWLLGRKCVPILGGCCKTRNNFAAIEIRGCAAMAFTFTYLFR